MKETRNSKKPTAEAEQSSRDRDTTQTGSGRRLADETPTDGTFRDARTPETSRNDPADRERGMPELQVSRLSPPVLVILVAAALALIVLLVVFGGLI